jgi:hypothetical protein
VSHSHSATAKYFQDFEKPIRALKLQMFLEPQEPPLQIKQYQEKRMKSSDLKVLWPREKAESFCFFLIGACTS